MDTGGQGPCEISQRQARFLVILGGFDISFADDMIGLEDGDA